MDDKTFHGTAVLSSLDGVTTVLVAFVFVCLIFPSIVKHKQQFYAALAMVLLAMVLHVLSLMLNKQEGAINFLAVGNGVLQIVSFLLLVLSVGGLTARQLAGDMARAYEVMRRGESEKETIIPIGGASGGGRRGGEDPRKVYHIDTGHTSSVDDDDDEDKGIPVS